MSELRNVEVTEGTEATAVVEETKKVGFWARLGEKVSDHKLGLAIGAGVVTLAIGIVALVKAGSKTEDIYDIDDVDFDAADLNVNTTENTNVTE